MYEELWTQITHRYWIPMHVSILVTSPMGFESLSTNKDGATPLFDVSHDVLFPSDISLYYMKSLLKLD